MGFKDVKIWTCSCAFQITARSKLSARETTWIRNCIHDIECWQCFSLIQHLIHHDENPSCSFIWDRMTKHAQRAFQAIGIFVLYFILSCYCSHVLKNYQCSEPMVSINICSLRLCIKTSSYHDGAVTFFRHSLPMCSWSWSCASVLPLCDSDNNNPLRPTGPHLNIKTCLSQV